MFALVGISRSSSAHSHFKPFPCSSESLQVAFALAQCVKLSLYEERIAKEMDADKDLPQALAEYATHSLLGSRVFRFNFLRFLFFMFLEEGWVSLAFLCT